MQDSVKIMNVDIDMMSNDVFIEKMNEYLAEDGLNTILFASTAMLDRAVEDEAYRGLLEKADLFLPGERALLTTHHVEVLEAGNMVVSYQSLGLVLENLLQEDRTLFIVARDQSSVDRLQSYCHDQCPKLRMVGSYIYDEAMEDAAVINEINNHTPDMLLIDLPPGMQEIWISGHKATLNARLCLAVGGVSGMMLAERREAPKWVKRLHLEGLYHVLFREMPVRRDVKALLFRKKIKRYHDENEVHDLREP